MCESVEKRRRVAEEKKGQSSFRMHRHFSCTSIIILVAFLLTCDFVMLCVFFLPRFVLFVIVAVAVAVVVVAVVIAAAVVVVGAAAASRAVRMYGSFVGCSFRLFIFLSFFERPLFLYVSHCFHLNGLFLLLLLLSLL